MVRSDYLNRLMESCPNIDIALLKAGDKTASSSSSPATWCSTRLTAAQKAPVRDGRHTVKGVVTDATDGQPITGAGVLLRGTTPDVGNMLQGKVAGVLVYNATGQPGEAGGTYTIDVPIDRLPLFEKL